MSRWGRVAALALCSALVACSVPLDQAGDGPAGEAAGPISALQAATVQLYQTGDEATLPILALGASGETLTLAFDVFDESTGRPLDVTFEHLDRDTPSGLLPTEVFTAFERDNLLDYRPSGNTAVPYVHYEYTFPNATIGFRISGGYRLTVRDPDGGALFSVPFYVSEESAEVDLGFGSTVVGGSANAIQPAARVQPGRRLEGSEAYRYTVCFARDGRLDVLRCAPEPSVLDQALFQFYLPRQEAFLTPPPLYAFDLGLLAPSVDVLDVDRAARPPTALLDLDYSELGGDLREAALTGTPLVAGAFRDAGRADTDAEYVDVTFRLVPPGEQPVGGPVYVRGSFNRYARSEPMAFDAEGGRYELTLLVKQGAYVYTYEAPRSRIVREGVSFGQPSLYTALVFYDDPTQFADRLVAVRTGLAR